MSYPEFINSKKEFYDSLFQFIDGDLNEEELQKFNGQLDDLQSDREEFREFLRLILKVYNGRKRVPNFFSKFDLLLQRIKTNLMEMFTNIEIFNFFKSNKRLLLSLLKSSIVTIDKEISEIINRKSHKTVDFEKKNTKYLNYREYFYPEMKPFLDEKIRKEIEKKLLTYGSDIFDNFDENRQLGENDSYMCSLIRQDSVEDFIRYLTQNSISPTRNVNFSIFETNAFLLNNEIALIDYAAFFGSIEIFNYLRLNNADLTETTWIASIHGKNPLIIHTIEENSSVKLTNKLHLKCLKESIKCHHNEIADYVQINLLCKNDDSYKNVSEFSDNIVAYSFHFYNYHFFPDTFNNKNLFAYMCQYNHYTFINVLLQTMRLRFNIKIVYIFVFFVSNFNFIFLIVFYQFNILI